MIIERSEGNAPGRTILEPTLQMWPFLRAWHDSHKRQFLTKEVLDIFDKTPHGSDTPP